MEDYSNVKQLLKTNKFKLMTDEEGTEVFDDNGNLLLYHEDGGKVLSVPNTEEIRRMYDLPLEPPENTTSISLSDIAKPGNLIPIRDEMDTENGNEETDFDMGETNADNISSVKQSPIKGIMKNKLSCSKTMSSTDFRKALRMEIEKRKSHTPGLYSDDSGNSLEQISRRPGEIAPEVVSFFLKLLSSERYQNILSKLPGRATKMWEAIFEEIQFHGYVIEGRTKEEKVKRLFQKWRNMKRTFSNYLVAKSKGKVARKPMFYDLMFHIFAKHEMTSPERDCESENEIYELEDGSNSDNSIDKSESTQLDHRYHRVNKSYSVGHSRAESASAVEMLQQIKSLVQARAESATEVLQQIKSLFDSRTDSVTSVEVLEQIKCLFETFLAMHEGAIQKQALSQAKMTSLLEKLVEEQIRLNSLVSEGFLNQHVRTEPRK